MKFRIDRQEQQLRELQQLNKELKRNAKIVCDMSKNTAQALKSEDFEQIYKTFALWENTLKTVAMGIENHLENTIPDRTTIER